METLILFGLIALHSIGNIISSFKTDSRISKLERDLEDRKAIGSFVCTIKGTDIVTGLNRSKGTGGAGMNINNTTN